MTDDAPPLPGIAAVIEAVCGLPPAPGSDTILGAAPPPQAVAAIDAPDRPPTLAARREAAQARLAGLKAAAADGVLRGEEPHVAAIPAAEAALVVLAAAEQMAHARARTAEAEASARRLAALRGRVEQLHRRRLAAIGEAQQAFETGAAALARAGQMLDAIKAAAVALGYPLPMALHDSETAMRLSRRVATTLAGLRPGRPADYGTIRWASTAWAFGLDPDWAKAESAATGRAIDELSNFTKGA